jgi:hypothetical protein
MMTGVLARTPLAELLPRLASDKETGTLTVTTSRGAGEVRFHEGDIADAVYLRLEGPKALTRLLGEREGTFTFMSRTPPVMRRIFTPSAQLISESLQQLVETARFRAAMGELASCALFALEGPGGLSAGELSEVAQLVLARLRSPATVDEVLDDVGAPDADVLRALAELDRAGRIRKLSHASQRVSVARNDELQTVRALSARARVPGFGGAARLLFAGTPGRLAVFAHSVLCLAEAVAPPELAPPVPIPHTMGSPLWPLAFAGSVAIVRLDDAAATALAEACATAEIPLLDVAALVGELDEGSATEVATIVRAALEGA